MLLVFKLYIVIVTYITRGLFFLLAPIDIAPCAIRTLEDAIGNAQAVICATGYSGFNPGAVGSVDETGTERLVDAALKRRVRAFVLLSSLLTNARAAGQADNPNYKFLNVFGGVLDHKLVRPGCNRQCMIIIN